MEERIKNARTNSCKMIFPEHLNDNGILFGGTALKWMDEVAYITATRYARMSMVTVAMEKVKFLLPVTTGKIIEITGAIVKTKTVKLFVQVDVFLEETHSENRQKAIEALFVFAPVDENYKPVRL